MAGLTLTLSADEHQALRQFAAKLDLDLHQAAALALRDWLIGNGYLEQHEIDEEADVDGTA